MGFRRHSGAADTSTRPQKKGPELAINSTLTWHTMASEITGARFSIPDKCSAADLNTPPSLPLLSSSSQSLSVKWRTGERAKWLCLLTGASEHLK